MEKFLQQTKPKCHTRLYAGIKNTPKATTGYPKPATGIYKPLGYADDMWICDERVSPSFGTRIQQQQQKLCQMLEGIVVALQWKIVANH